MTWGLLRVAAQLRRIAKALEQANEFKREEIDRSSRPMKDGQKRMVMSRPTVDQWNEKHGGLR